LLTNKNNNLSLKAHYACNTAVYWLKYRQPRPAVLDTSYTYAIKSTIKVNDRATSPRRSCRYQLSNYYRYKNCFTFRKYVKRKPVHYKPVHCITQTEEPKKHGRQFKINDESTWWPTDATVEINDPKLGLIRVSQWQQLHFKTASQQKLSLIKVERLNPKKTGEAHRPLWLIWVGEAFLSLEKVWSQYARRFGVDHWYRFALAKITLDFTFFEYTCSM
jgi:hypothetical protein